MQVLPSCHHLITVSSPLLFCVATNSDFLLLNVPELGKKKDFKSCFLKLLEQEEINQCPLYSVQYQYPGTQTLSCQYDGTPEKLHSLKRVEMGENTELS